MICAVEQVARFRRNRAEVGGSAKVVDRSAIELGAGEEHRPAERSATLRANWVRGRAPTGERSGTMVVNRSAIEPGPGEEHRPAERSATLRANWCRGRTPTDGAVGDYGGRSLRDRTGSG